MKEIINDAKKYFEAKQNYIDLFVKYNTRAEGWFQGELLKFFSSDYMKIKHGIEIKSVGKPVGKRKPDLILNVDGKKEIIELKAISVQDWRTLDVYFKVDEGLAKAFKTLSSSKTKEYLLTFAYPKPEDWKEKIKEAEKKYGIEEILKESIGKKLLISLLTNSK